MSVSPSGTALLGQAIARRLVLAAFSLLTAANALAQKPPDTSAGEIALLPAYCPDTMGFNYGDAYTNTSPRAAHWVGLMGKSFWAMHHYCWGLIKYRRATSGLVPSQVRLGYLQSALNEWDYVLRNSSADFVMLPEIYLRLGETHVQLKSYGPASAAFDESRRHKPDYPPPYLRWAEVLVMIGNKKGALAHLELGLRQAPTAPDLLAQYKRLGGNAEGFIKALPALPASAPAMPASAADRSAAPGQAEAAPAPPHTPAAKTAPAAASS